jgi:MoaA/NifB/PqqE/SkfB family radical SAM enzyme/glycosyltransferase involved in cell wall biosynthesis
LNNKRYSLLIISGEKFSRNMAGIALRQTSIAKILSKVSDVSIASPYDTEDIQEVEFIKFNQNEQDSLRNIVSQFDMILFQGHILHHYPFLKKIDKIMIVDVFSPIVFESLNWHQYESFDKRLFFHDLDLMILNEQLEVGDFFICSSEVQKRFWIGMLTALNRVSPHTIDHDDVLNKLICIIPYGISGFHKEKSRNVIKGVHPRVTKDDHLLIWNGGIYNWLDPKTPIEAMVKICQKRTDVKLFFLGTKHPNPEIPVMPACLNAIKLAESYGLADHFIFFLEWTKADERFDYILESDATLSFYYNNIETRYSYRTRLLDNIATGIAPIVTDCGDTFSKMIKDYHLGEVIPPEDVDFTEKVIEKLVENRELRDEYKQNLEDFSDKMLWDIVLSPLIEFISNPLKSNDYGKGSTGYNRVYSKDYYFPSHGKVYPSIVQYLDENDFIPDLKDLYVESTSYCNLSCDMCLITAPEPSIPMRKRFGKMTFDTFRKLDDVLPFIDFLSLNGTGEALLHPELFDMIDHAKKILKSSTKVSFNTNGMLLSSENIERIFASEVDIIIVSLDAPEKDLYDKIRIRGDFNQVMTNLKNLASEKKRRKLDKPEIGIETVAMKRNFRTLPDIVKIAAEVDASIFAVTNMIAYKHETADEVLYDGKIQDEITQVLEKTKDLALKSGIMSVRIPNISLDVKRKCWFYDKSIIKWDGSVMPCCQLVDSYRFYIGERAFDEKELSFGNINESNMIDIWNSKEYAEFRFQVRSSKFPPACQACLWNGVI